MKTTAINDRGLNSGDVIELELDGESATALVLLASDKGVIVDHLDDSTPSVILWEELSNVRIFSPMALAA